MFSLKQALQTIHDLLASHKLMEFCDYIETLSHQERILVRKELEACKPHPILPRNLYYDYKKQCWID